MESATLFLRDSSFNLFPQWLGNIFNGHRYCRQTTMTAKSNPSLIQAIQSDLIQLGSREGTRMEEVKIFIGH